MRRIRVRLRTARARRAAAALLILAGVLLLADAATTLVWQEPVSALRAADAQQRLGAQLRRLEAAAPARRAAAVAVHAARAPDRRRVAALAQRLDRRLARGAAVGRLRIPRLGLGAVLVHGSAAADLRRGPGTIDGAPLPGGPGTAAVAGHRTTYGAPFRDIDQLRRGDLVVAEMPYATLRYRVEGRWVVAPAQVGVLRRTRHDRLALVACHPRFSAARRLVVIARLEAVRPAGRLA